jgi:hypothetical protein
MSPCAVTNVSRSRAAVLLMVCAGCAGGAAPGVPAALSPAQIQVCKDVERAYREADPDYARLRGDAVRDPAVAGWLTRLFVLDLFRVREGRPLGKDEDLLRAAARIEDPVESRAIGEIEALGALAVPVLVADLLQNSQPQPRELGIELLSRIGMPALPALQAVARDGEPRHRRAAARALGLISQDEAVFAVLRSLAGDGDYTVRADALRGFRSGDAGARALLIQHLENDDDPFVRRVAAQSLAHFPSASAATALIGYLERCKQERDVPGEQAAQASLQVFAGTRGPRTPDAWRVFAASLGDPTDAPRTEGSPPRRTPK